MALAAFAVRLAHAWFVSQTPFFEGPVIDAQTYRHFAEHLAKTGDFGGAFYQPPLYPVFLALLFRAGLTSAWAVAAVQCALGAATASLMVLVGRRLASSENSERWVGLAVGLATALYGPLVFYDVELMPPSLVHLLLTGALVLALRPARFGLVDAVIGLLLGAAVIGWTLSAIVGAGILALRASRVPAPRWRSLLLASAFALPPVVVTAQHNAAHDGEGVLVSFNSGINLWLGNNQNWRETWRARPGARFEPELERPDREGITRPGERSAYFVRRVVRDVEDRPLAAFARTAEKFYYVWHGREIRRNQDIQLVREASPVLRALTWEVGLYFPFGVVAPLAGLGLWRRRKEPDLRVLAGTVFAYAIAVALFFVSSRYRLPMALLLLPVAVDHAFYLMNARTHARRWAAPLVALLVVLNLPNAFTKSFAADAADRQILEAHAWRSQGNLARAEEISEKVVKRFPDDANVQMLRAELLEATGRCKAAVDHLKRVIELAPRAAAPRVMLGTCLGELGDPGAAERAFAGALSLHPHHPVALKRVGALYASYGRVIEAHAMLTRFVQSGYDDPEVMQWLEELAPARARALESRPAQSYGK